MEKKRLIGSVVMAAFVMTGGIFFTANPSVDASQASPTIRQGPEPQPIVPLTPQAPLRKSSGKKRPKKVNAKKKSHKSPLKKASKAKKSAKGRGTSR